MKYECKPCGFETEDKSKYSRHLTSNKHTRGGQLIGGMKYHCAVCDVDIRKTEDLTHHLTKPQHKRNVNKHDEYLKTNNGIPLAGHIDLSKRHLYITSKAGKIDWKKLEQPKTEKRTRTKKPKAEPVEVAEPVEEVAEDDEVVEEPPAPVEDNTLVINRINRLLDELKDEAVKTGFTKRFSRIDRSNTNALDEISEDLYERIQQQEQ